MTYDVVDTQGRKVNTWALGAFSAGMMVKALNALADREHTGERYTLRATAVRA